MKEVLAVVRINKMNDTKVALANAGIYSLTARKVHGRGRGRGKVEYYLYGDGSNSVDNVIDQQGDEHKLIPKRMLNMVVPDDKVQTVIDTLIKTNQSGHPGDGKIFVIPVSDSIRVRTGEIGDAALDELIG